jgi:hypothetical protein
VKKYDTGMVSSGVKFRSDFVKIGYLVQKLKEGTKTHETPFIFLGKKIRLTTGHAYVCYEQKEASLPETGTTVAC